MKKNIIPAIALLLITACNPSPTEKRAIEQNRRDSLEKVDIEKKEEIRIHNERIEVGKSIKEEKLYKMIGDLNRAIVDEKKKLNQIGKFKIGRSQSDKQRQLSKQQQAIWDLESIKYGLEKEVPQTKLFNSFDFQSTPKGTIEYLIQSTKNNDFKKFRYLIDPYGEFDMDVFSIALLDNMPENSKNEWRELFENARIIGEPKITGNTASIEVAIGLYSNKLEKMNLVERDNKWYLKSF